MCNTVYFILFFKSTMKAFNIQNKMWKLKRGVWGSLYISDILLSVQCRIIIIFRKRYRLEIAERLRRMFNYFWIPWQWTLQPELKVKGRKCQNHFTTSTVLKSYLRPQVFTGNKKDWLMPITRGTLEPLSASSNYSKEIMVTYENGALVSRCLAYLPASFILKMNKEILDLRERLKSWQNCNWNLKVADIFHG